MCDRQRVFEDGNTIFITGEINSGMEDVRGYLRDLVLNGATEVTLIINSIGGSCAGALAMVDAIMEARNKGVTIIGLVEGIAFSSALTVLQACTRRKAGRYSRLLAHGTTDTVEGTLQHQLDAAENTKVLHELIADLYASRTPRSATWWTRLFGSKDHYLLTAAGALEAGWIDEISGS